MGKMNLTIEIGVVVASGLCKDWLERDKEVIMQEWDIQYLERGGI